MEPLAEKEVSQNKTLYDVTITVKKHFGKYFKIKANDAEKSVYFSHTGLLKDRELQINELKGRLLYIGDSKVDVKAIGGQVQLSLKKEKTLQEIREMMTEEERSIGEYDPIVDELSLKDDAGMAYTSQVHTAQKNDNIKTQCTEVLSAALYQGKRLLFEEFGDEAKVITEQAFKLLHGHLHENNKIIISELKAGKTENELKQELERSWSNQPPMEAYGPFIHKAQELLNKSLPLMDVMEAMETATAEYLKPNQARRRVPVH